MGGAAGTRSAPPTFAVSRRNLVGAEPARHRRLVKRIWTEYALSPKSSLGVFLNARPVFDLAQSAAGKMLSRRAAIWAQSYRGGERIAWHRDIDGEIQFLLCIQSPGEDAGGRFCLRANKTKKVLALGDGDALLFKATALEHSTTRIVGPFPEAPQRITAVARFFAR